MSPFPTFGEVEARIAHVRAHPELRPPSNDYCRACMMCGLAHCSDPINCGGRVSYDASQGNDNV